MFGFDQRQRLMREENWTATGLAQEIWAMMQPDVPNNTQAPVNVALPQGSTAAPFQVAGFSDGETIFNITKGNGQKYGDISIVGGQFMFTDPNGKQTSMGGGGGGTTVPVWG